MVMNAYTLLIDRCFTKVQLGGLKLPAPAPPVRGFLIFEEPCVIHDHDNSMIQKLKYKRTG